MKITGIVAEYNPFHNGHAHHIEKTWEQTGCDGIVGVMSTHFVQRGEPAFADKWARARMALLGGCDLILELPTPYVLSSAEGFARGALMVLQAFNCIDSLSFGCEEDNLSDLQTLADTLCDQDYLQKTKMLLKGGVSFPAARQEAVKDRAAGLHHLLAKPNNILAVEYLKAIKRLHVNIAPVAVKRHMAGHDDAFSSGRFASASHIRKLISDQKMNQVASLVPKQVFAEIQKLLDEGSSPLQTDHLEQLVLFALRGMTTEKIALLPDVTEGLENRIKNCAMAASSLPDYYFRVKTKRYVLSRLKRISMSALIGLDRALCGMPPPYIRVLGFNETGRRILNIADKTALVPIITKGAHIKEQGREAPRFFEAEKNAAAVYSLLLRNERDRNGLRELTEMPVIVP